MGIYRTLFAVFSALSLVTVIWTGVRDMAPEWKAYQSEYYDLLQKKLEAAGQKDFRRPALEVQQIWQPALRRTDRCTTCHMGVENAEHFADAPQPYRSHPGKYLEWHPSNKFGCTSCHKGQGLATDFAYAAHTPPDLDVPRWKRLVRWIEKGTDDPTSMYSTAMQENVEELKKKIEEAEKKLERWEHDYGYDEHKLEFFHDYMLPAKYIESSCMRCHDSRAIEPYAPTIAKARQLITDVHKCRRCHSIPQIPDLPGEPEAPCPELLGFGDKNAHNLDFGNPDAVDSKSGFPHTGANIDVLRGIHHDPIVWTVEHFMNPQLFILTSEMAKLEMTYADAEILTTFVRGLAKELPAREYVAARPLIPAGAPMEGTESLFVTPPVIAQAASPAAGAPAVPPQTAPAAEQAAPAEGAPATPAQDAPAAPAPEAQPTPAQQ